MTREEFIHSQVSEEGWKQYQRDLISRQKGEATTGFAKRWDATHQVAVEDALFKGELVPAEVLMEYPGLRQPIMAVRRARKETAAKAVALAKSSEIRGYGNGD